ncbi:DsbC family protein [Rubrivivax gelatinosus]|uniref:Thiol:disulfide interchange protein n=1 Tax=Rubrivivax gelatinosus TaxID=28068 RepID=A0A4V2SGT4_RUBGE|nr:DsbC family protein [Rubrivivax gelatinosus]MBK1689334.1 disulfide isomerase [Rubrivivax gelatinosus]TCP02488.1 thiol:disulfide interchange protein DsbC [Rubrivivax gelatinosus]
MKTTTARLALAAAAVLACGSAAAQEAAIRKALAERLPTMPRIDEVRPAPIAGLYEVRYGGTEILYADAKGEFIIQGSILDTKTLSNLTEARQDQLTAIDFAKLPFKDAITLRQGSGKRQVAVFVDPNCGYCKRFERDLAGVKDLTIHAFLMPILGPDSNAKSRDIWCAKDPAKTWRAWMLDNVVPPKAMGACDAGALARNVALGQRHRINGTPAVVFEDGTRKPGAIPIDQVEKLLAAAARKS